MSCLVVTLDIELLENGHSLSADTLGLYFTDRNMPFFPPESGGPKRVSQKGFYRL